jgi:hypothetical protein
MNALKMATFRQATVVSANDDSEPDDAVSDTKFGSCSVKTIA